MPTKKKRQSPKKSQKQVIKSVNKQRKSAFDTLWPEIDDLCFEVATIADKFLDLLPRFKKLSHRDKRIIYDHMGVVSDGLVDSLDKYHEALPKHMRDDSESDGDIGRSIAGALGLAAAIGLAFRKVGKPEDKDPEWPDGLDLKDGMPEHPKLKLLNPKGDDDAI